jgi:glycosyltransferase involved in cell wall biosynthesis
MDKRIAYLTSVYARAGDTFIRREVEELRARGWTVHTFSIRHPDAGEQVSDEILREQRTTDYILDRGFWRLLAAFARMSLRSPGRMIRAMAQARAIRWPGLRSAVWHAIYLLEASYLAEQLVGRDVALLHDHIAMNSGTVAMLASTLSGVPFSMTVHGLELLSADQWGLGRKIAASAATVCISSFGKGQCMAFAPPAHWHKLHVVRCGLDVASFDAETSSEADAPRLVCVGRLSPEKGQVLLVQAAALLRDRGVDLEIVLVGDGPSRADVERAVRELGLGKAIRMEGWRSSDEVRRWISRSRALVLPSFSEGIPVVLMEAMALRRPVIATYVGGVPELVREGENGWLVPAGSVEDLADAMREALRAPARQLDEMGERGRRTVLERHDISVESRKLEDLFRRAGRDADPA